IIPNGVFLEELEPLPKPGAFRAAHQQVGDHPFVLFLSRLQYKKGLDHLANAFALAAGKLDRAHLVVAGPDEGEQAGFQRRIEAAGLTDRVHLVGPLYERRKIEALVDATCFCLPSRQEGFSVAITEALACGVPVVVTEACHFPEVGQVGAGRVVPLDDEAIAAALVEVMSDQALGAQMGRQGRALIAERFTWQRIAKRTIEAYERVVQPSALS
ncbi:MAG: glycosyltransferase, partial [Halioglobus sp.]|nr:glycosyltransferase [Halioglobus sp.]